MLINSPNISGSLKVTGNAVITGSLTVLGGINGAIEGTAATASYVQYTSVANKPTLVSGSSQISFTGITSKPTLVSGSGQISFTGIIDKPTLVSGSSQITYSGLSGIPSGIVSSSTQITGYNVFATTGSNQFNGSQSITGSLTVTGQVIAQTLNVQEVTSSIVFSSGSNIFGNNSGNKHQFTGSVSVTGSLAVAGAGSFSGTGYFGGATVSSGLTGASELIVQNELGIQNGDTTGPYLRMVMGGVNQNITLVTGAFTGTEPNLLFSIGGATRLTVSSTGTATFDTTAAISAAFNSTNESGGYIGFRRSGTSIGYLGNSAQLGQGVLNALELRADNNLFLTTTSGLLTMTSGGNVGIGTTSVSGTYEKLAVAGGISIKDNTNAKLEIGRYNTTGAQNSYIKLGANSNSLRFTNNTDTVDIMELTNSGTLSIFSPSGTTGALLIKGGKNDVTGVGEVNSRLDFGSNDTSVSNDGNIGGRIESVTEFSNGAFTGLSFLTYQQGRSPDLKEALRLYNDGSAAIAGNLTINNTLSSPGNLIENAGLNVYLRPASGYSVFIDTGNGLTVTNNVRSIVSSPVCVGDAFQNIFRFDAFAQGGINQANSAVNLRVAFALTGGFGNEHCTYDLVASCSNGTWTIHVDSQTGRVSNNGGNFQVSAFSSGTTLFIQSRKEFGGGCGYAQMNGMINFAGCNFSTA